MKTYTITTRYINEYVRVVEAKSKKEALEMGNEIAPLKPIDVTPDTDEGHAKYIAECDAEWASHWKSSSI